MIDQLSYPLISLAGITRQLLSVRPICQEMEEFLCDSPEGLSENERSDFHSDIVFRDISFHYDKQSPVLEDFHAVLEKGKKYLWKGPSGCGKTTAVNLLLGYYAPTRGTIEIDGVALKPFQNIYSCVRCFGKRKEIPLERAQRMRKNHSSQFASWLLRPYPGYYRNRRGCSETFSEHLFLRYCGTSGSGIIS